MPVDMFERLRTDPGHRTLGELLQERQWAVPEIERLRAVRAPPPSVRRAVDAVVSGAATLVKKASPEPLSTAAPISPFQLLRLPDVTRMVGLSRSTIYQMIEQGRFPAGVRLGARARGWRMGDVVAWLERLGD
jgi:prophage regulatory protein